MSHLHHYPMPFLASPVLSSPRPLTLHAPHPRHDFQPRSFLPLAANVGYQEVYEGGPTWAAGYDGVASGPRGGAMDGDFDEEGHTLHAYVSEAETAPVQPPCSPLVFSDPFDTSYEAPSPYADGLYSQYSTEPYQLTYEESRTAYSHQLSLPRPEAYYVAPTVRIPPIETYPRQIPSMAHWQRYILSSEAPAPFVQPPHREYGDASTYSLSLYNTPPTPRPSLDHTYSLLSNRTIYPQPALNAHLPLWAPKPILNVHPAPHSYSNHTTSYLPSPPLPSPDDALSPLSSCTPSPVPSARPSTPSGPELPEISQPHIPRPRNSFILFRSWVLKSKTYDPANNPGEKNVSKIVGDLWRALDKSKRRVWEEKAVVEKARHAADHPGYRYKPVQNKRKSMEAKEGDEEVVVSVKRVRVRVAKVVAAQSRRESEEDLYTPRSTMSRRSMVDAEFKGEVDNLKSGSVSLSDRSTRASRATSLTETTATY